MHEQSLVSRLERLCDAKISTDRFRKAKTSREGLRRKHPSAGLYVRDIPHYKKKNFGDCQWLMPREMNIYCLLYLGESIAISHLSGGGLGEPRCMHVNLSRKLMTSCGVNHSITRNL